VTPRLARTKSGGGKGGGTSSKLSFVGEMAIN